VPILIHGWGTDLYGEWLVVFSAASSLSIADVGLWTYFGNALLIAWSRADTVGFRRLFTNATFLYAVIVGLAFIALAIASAFVSWPALLATRLLSPTAAVTTASILALTTLVLLPFGLVTSFYRVHGDYSRGTVMSIMVEALRGLGVCLVVWFGGSPVAAAGVNLAVAVLFWAGVLLDLRRRYGPLPLGMSVPTSAELRLTVTKSSLYLASTVVSPVIVNAPILLLGMLLSSPAEVVAYSTARTFTGLMRQIVSQFSQLIGIEMTRQIASGDRVRLSRIYAGAGRMIGGIAGLLGGFTLVIAPSFLRIWTRGQVAFDPYLVCIFVATVVLIAPATVAQMYYIYNNKPGILTAAQVGYGVVTMVLCLLLIHNYSAAGAAAGTGLAELLTIGAILPFTAAKEISFSPVRYFCLSYGTAVACFAISWIVAIAAAALIMDRSFIGLTELGVLWTGIIVTPAFFLILERDERGWILQVIKQFLIRTLQPRNE
jgi:O-antigen/teichoic acid export membrane protein